MHDAPPLEPVSPAPVTPQPKSHSIGTSHALQHPETSSPAPVAVAPDTGLVDVDDDPAPELDLQTLNDAFEEEETGPALPAAPPSTYQYQLVQPVVDNVTSINKVAPYYGCDYGEFKAICLAPMRDLFKSLVFPRKALWVRAEKPSRSAKAYTMVDVHWGQVEARLKAAIANQSGRAFMHTDIRTIKGYDAVDLIAWFVFKIRDHLFYQPAVLEDKGLGFQLRNRRCFDLYRLIKYTMRSSDPPEWQVSKAAPGPAPGPVPFVVDLTADQMVAKAAGRPDEPAEQTGGSDLRAHVDVDDSMPDADNHEQASDEESDVVDELPSDDESDVVDELLSDDDELLSEQEVIALSDSDEEPEVTTPAKTRTKRPFEGGVEAFQRQKKPISDVPLQHGVDRRKQLHDDRIPKKRAFWFNQNGIPFGAEAIADELDRMLTSRDVDWEDVEAELDEESFQGEQPADPTTVPKAPAPEGGAKANSAQEEDQDARFQNNAARFRRWLSACQLKTNDPKLEEFRERGQDIFIRDNQQLKQALLHEQNFDPNFIPDPDQANDAKSDHLGLSGVATQPEFRKHALDVNRLLSNTKYQPTNLQEAMTGLFIKRRTHPVMPGCRTTLYWWQTLGAFHLDKARIQHTNVAGPALGYGIPAPYDGAELVAGVREAGLRGQHLCDQVGIGKTITALASIYSVSMIRGGFGKELHIGVCNSLPNPPPRLPCFRFANGLIVCVTTPLDTLSDA